MARCEGTTKSGNHCRRQAGSSSSYCSSHEPASAQASDANPTDKTSSARPSTSKEGRSARKKHPLENAAIVGVVAIGLLALRRVIRLF